MPDPTKKDYSNIDIKALIKQYGEIQVPKSDLCKLLKMSVDTFDRNPEWVEIYNNAKSTGRTRLRQKQIEVAMNGNPTMLIFLGKAMLGQSDTTNVKISSPQGETLNVNSNVNITQLLSDPTFASDVAKSLFAISSNDGSETKSRDVEASETSPEAE